MIQNTFFKKQHNEIETVTLVMTQTYMYQVMVQNWPQFSDDGEKSSNKSLCPADFAHSGHLVIQE